MTTTTHEQLDYTHHPHAQAELVAMRDGFLYRKGTKEHGMRAGCKRQVLGLGLRTDDLVLDLGAHIGAFEWFARQVDTPPKKIVAVEADPTNVDVLCRNVLPKNVEVVHAAVVGDGGPTTIDFWLTGGSGTVCGSPHHKRGRTQYIKVPAVGFRALLQQYRPTVLKVDIEGTEYDLDWHNLPDYIRAISLELHPPEEKREVFLPVLFQQGFEVWEEFGNLIGQNFILVRGGE